MSFLSLTVTKYSLLTWEEIRALEMEIVDAANRKLIEMLFVRWYK